LKEKLLIWGARGHALVVADIAQLSGKFEVVGYIDNVNSARAGESFAGTMVLGGIDALPRMGAEGVRSIAIAVGSCAARLQLGGIATQHGFDLATLIHPNAVLARDVRVGVGTVVAAGAVINPGSSIGKLVIVNTNASVDHECVLADGAHISPGVHLGGRVSVGASAWIGIGASVKDGVQIGARAVIGAGSVVVKDVPAGLVAYGCPARVKKTCR
jgi:acetyltransferase EpsM